MTDCSCNCTCGPFNQCGICTSVQPNPAPPYNIPFLPIGTNYQGSIVTGVEQPYANNWIQSQSNAQYPFSTNPNWPLEPNANAYEIQTNNEAKSIFTALNNQSAQVQAGQRTLNGPIFKSYHDLIRYKQAQYAQAFYLPKKSVGDLFYPNGSNLFPS